jgi:SH3-like domain-containing protein
MVAVLACAMVFASGGSAGASPHSQTVGSRTVVAAPAAFAEFREDGVRIRTGPGTNYAVAGLGYRNHSVTAHCFVAPIPNSAWYKITDNTTGVHGWVASSLLYIEGSFPGC